jgi:hypothetical protein
MPVPAQPTASMATAAEPTGGGMPLNAEHFAALEAARQRIKPLRRAAGMATFNTWTIGLFAVPAVLLGVFEPGVLITGLALCVVAWNEHRGGKKLRILDESAPRLLGWNQLALLAVIIAYGSWRLASTIFGAGHYDQQLAAHPELAPTLEPLGDMIQFVTVLVYTLVIAFSVIFQGLNSWYYFSRARKLREYLTQTPGWVVQMLRAAA